MFQPIWQAGKMSQSDGESKRKSGDDTVAVALGYCPGGEFAPKVVAGGRGAIAEQILQIAFANDIKVREDSDLAQLLSAIDIDSEIPVEAFAAVAEILVYMYRANGMPLAHELNDAPEDSGNTTPEATP